MQVRGWRAALAGAAMTVAALAGTSAAAHAATVLAIGRADGSAAEFALAPNHYGDYPSAFPQDVDVSPASDPARAWSYIQPGPKDSWAGSRSHTYTLHFTLPSDGVRDLRLQLDLLDTNASPPHLAIGANGTDVETLTTQPGADRGEYGDGGTQPQTLLASVPARSLHAGDNTVTITTADGSWVVYDAVTLRDPLPLDAVPRSIAPTPLIVREAGAERQLVDVVGDNAGDSGAVTFTARAGDAAPVVTTVTVPPGRFRARIEVPPAPKGDPQPLTVTTDSGRTLRTTLPYQRRWTVDLIHGSHQDIGYTATQPEVRAQQDRYLDTVARACEDTRDRPDASKFRWTIEHAWMLDNYVEDRPASAVDALARCARRGQVELTGAYDNNLFDLASPEQLARSYYKGTRTLADRLGVRVDAAMQDDVTGVSSQDVQALAKAGVKYLINGPNPTRAPRAQTPPSLFWWQGPDGSRVLTWFGTEASYVEGYNVGFNAGPGAIDRQASGVADRLTELQRDGYPADVYPMLFLLDNLSPQTTISDTLDAFGAKYVWPKVKMGTPTTFFHAVEQEGRTAQLPVRRGDFSDWWSDGAGSSAHETTINREAQVRSTSAETLGTLAAQHVPDLARERELDQSYENEELYTEHTWGAAGLSWDDPEWPFKRAFAEDADAQSRSALDSASRDLGSLVSNRGPWPQLTVFNSLSWTRTDAVEATVPVGRLTGGPFVLLDGRRQVPYEIVRRTADDVTVRFVARDVPGVGYRTYALRPASPHRDAQQGSGRDPELDVSTQGLENRFFRVRLNPRTGAIASILDKRRGVDLVDHGARYGVNQFVYRPNCPTRSDCPTSDAHEWTPTDAQVRVLARGPVDATVEVTHSVAPGGAVTGVRSLTERITLHAGVPRVDIADTVDKLRVETPEEGYYAFPFKVDDPQITYEASGTPVRFIQDQLPGSALDWIGIDHYADVSDASGGVTFSAAGAPLVEFDRIRTDEFEDRPGRLDRPESDPSGADLMPRTGAIYSYVYNNLWFTNYRIAQSGPTTFRYAIQSHAGGFDPLRETRAGNDADTPLVGAGAGARQSGPLHDGAQALASVSAPNVLVQTIKQAYPGQQGVAVRLREIAGRAGTVTLRLPFAVGEARLTDLVERGGQALPVHGDTVRVPLEGHGMATVAVVPDVSLDVSAKRATLPRGTATTAIVTLRNTTPRWLRGTVSLDAPDGVTVTPARRSVAVPPRASATTSFTVAAPDGAALGTRTLTARADVGGGVDVAARQLAFAVVDPIELTAAPERLDLDEGGSQAVRLTATNNLDHAVTFDVAAELPDGFTADPARQSVSLDGGESKTVTATVTAHAGTFGSATLAFATAGDVAPTRVELPATVGRPLFTVGSVDGSTSGFALSPAGYQSYAATFPDGVDFTVGSDDPASAWSYVQAGPEDTWAGSRAHRSTVRFGLDAVPGQDLTFTAWLLDTNNVHPPTIEVSLNGGAPQEIALPAGGGDGYHWGDGQPNQYSGVIPTVVNVPLPRAALRAGENAVTITTATGAWIVYDAFGVRMLP